MVCLNSILRHLTRLTKISVEDDYEAFRALLRSHSSLQVLVRVGQNASGDSQVSSTSIVRVFPLFMPIPQADAIATSLVHERSAPTRTSQFIVGPPSELPASASREDQSKYIHTPPRKKKKIAAAATTTDVFNASILESPAAEGVAPPMKKPKKKKNRTREMSSGSAADLSSNIAEPLDGVRAELSRKTAMEAVIPPSGVLDEPVRAATATLPTEKATEKHKAAVNLPPRATDAAPTAPTRTLDFIKFSRMAKRPTDLTNDSEIPLAKKSKKTKELPLGEALSTAHPIPDSVSNEAEQAKSTQPQRKSKKTKSSPVAQEQVDDTAPASAAVQQGSPPKAKGRRKGRQSTLAQKEHQMEDIQGRRKKKKVSGPSDICVEPEVAEGSVRNLAFTLYTTTNCTE
jgi:hypothetical protein